MTQDVVGILGPGAVGHMLAYFFHQLPSVAVQMRGRSGLLPETRPVHFQNQAQVIPLQQSYPLARLWFCSLKTYALVDGLRDLMRDLTAPAQIIVLSNGYIEPLLQPLRREFPAISLRKGLVVRGVKPFEDGYEVGPKGQVIWGDDQPETALAQRLLQGLAGEGFQWNPQCCQLRREKWFYNCCLNTLCGVHRLASNGLALDKHEQELADLAKEVFLLAQELWPEWKPDWTELWQKLLQVIHSSRDNENSMAADVRMGRRTEAACLSGLVLGAREPHAYPLLLRAHQGLAA